MDTGRTLKPAELPRSGSFLFTLDPRTKTLLVLLFTIIVFAVSKLPLSGGLALIFAGLWFAAGMPLKKIGSYLKFLSALIVFIIIMQMLFGPGDRYILKPLIPETVPLAGGTGSLKWDGLVLGAVISLRLIALTLLLPMLTMTTPPRLLTQGFVRLGLNYRAAYIITTALNFIPAFEHEARMIMNARKLRGMRAFEHGGLRAKFAEYSAAAVPLIINAMRKAQLAGAAMDARAFGAYSTKTWLCQIRFSARDYAALISGAVFSCLVLALNFLF